MQTQTEMFRTSVLAKYRGHLVLIKVNPFGGPGKCPECGEAKFRDAPGRWDAGWVECCNDECDFQVLKSHLDEVESQWTEASDGEK